MTARNFEEAFSGANARRRWSIKWRARPGPDRRSRVLVTGDERELSSIIGPLFRSEGSEIALAQAGRLGDEIARLRPHAPLVDIVEPDPANAPWVQQPRQDSGGPIVCVVPIRPPTRSKTSPCSRRTTSSSHRFRRPSSRAVHGFSSVGSAWREPVAVARGWRSVGTARVDDTGDRVNARGYTSEVDNN